MYVGLTQASEEVTRLQGELEAAKAETHAAVAHGASLQEQLAERDLQLGQQTSRADDLQQQLEKALADAKELQHQLAQVRLLGTPHCQSLATVVLL